MNAFLKGILFVQEMYDIKESSVDKIFKEQKEKYKFMLNIGEQSDKVVFQGSSSEGKDHIRCLEILEPQGSFTTCVYSNVGEGGHEMSTLLNKFGNFF